MKAGKTKQKQIHSKMANFSPNISIITLNINVLKVPIKRQRLGEYILKLYTVYKKLTSNI